MRVVITSDFHIREVRLADTKVVLNQIADFAVEKRVDWLWCLGDVFQHRNPTVVVQEVINNWIVKLTNNGIMVLIIIGNHDASGSVTAIDYFKTLKVKNVQIEESPYIFNGKYYLGHHALRESKMGPLSYSDDGQDIGVQDLISKYPKVKAFFLGHIHSPQVINKKPPILHVGSIDRIDFGERLENKRFLYLSDRIYSITIKNRPMIQIDLTTENIELPEIPEGAIVKLSITGKKSEIKSLDLKGIIEKIPNPYSLKVAYNPIRESMVRSRIINETASPVQCLKEYGKIKDLSKGVLELGKKIIIKEDR